MEFLFDANVLSEPTKEVRSQTVLDWLGRHETQLAANPIIVAELEYGILQLPAGRRRTRLLNWFETGAAPLRVLELDRETAHIWAALLASLKRQRRAMPIQDTLIAATALQYGLTVATRNTSDYRYAGVRCESPFNLFSRPAVEEDLWRG